MTYPPLFSIIMPSFERPSSLRRCLQSLAALDFPSGGFEVIVVDDGGRDDLSIVIASVAALIDIRLMRQTKSGPATARNYGASIANGRFLAFIDDDCRADPDWLRALQFELEASPRVLVGGKTINGLPHNPYSTASQALIDYLYDYAQKRPSSGLRFFTSNNMAMAATAFAETGGFDAAMPLAAGEDREFCDRWLTHGREMVFVPEALIYHDHQLTIQTFWRQHFNYGRGAFQFHRRHTGLSDGRIRLEPAAFYGRLLRYPFGYAASPWQISTLLLISQVANAAGFFGEKFKGVTPRP